MTAAAAASPGPFGRRASKVVSNAGLYQLVEDMAKAVDRQGDRLGEISDRLDAIHAMCTTILTRLS